jgi:nucleoside-diphosphate-sugar epimerase
VSAISVSVIGAGGFIGSAVVAAARADARVGKVREVFRPCCRRAGVAVADVRDPDQVAAAVTGVDVIVNAAHVIGAGADLAVNRIGPDVVAEVGARVGARCVEIGTAAVYGRGPLRGGAEGTLPPAPDSDLSASRAEGEERALAAGATVLRPMFVIGPGDRWAVPSASTAAAAAPNAPSARVGVVDVADLARLVVSVALLRAVPPLLHVARRQPVHLARLVADAGYRPPPDAIAPSFVTNVLHTDRWVGADLAWELVGWEPDGPVVSDVARRWYGAASCT